ncbi:hypothetical protein LNKW23_47750 [Paralimibaculum aggregatum]|uniref:Uncharacterized protein n=1 Tax=Paralimibaculum aggregatum TaxID=3036245 RepID=A0ABQ6LU27_9RHOB|nr:hypothetical protein [Limibaculum sp. NKW23]GMG85552.1 hypothetical protein LNKW23_47750 [Limibaculum sp. NKW23]
MTRTTARIGAALTAALTALALASGAAAQEETREITKNFRIGALDIDPPLVVVQPRQQITPCTAMIVDPEHFRERRGITAGQLLVAPLVTLLIESAASGRALTLYYDIGEDGTCRVTRAAAAYDGK